MKERNLCALAVASGTWTSVLLMKIQNRSFTWNCFKNVVIFVAHSRQFISESLKPCFIQITKMSFSCLVVFFFVFIVIFAIVIANVANLISNLSLSQESFSSANNRRWLEHSNVLRIDDSQEHLMWFVQVSWQ